MNVWRKCFKNASHPDDVSIHLSFIHIDRKENEIKAFTDCRLKVGVLRGCRGVGGRSVRVDAEKKTDYYNAVESLLAMTGCFVGQLMKTGLDLECNQETSTLIDLLLFYDYQLSFIEHYNS